VFISEYISNIKAVGIFKRIKKEDGKG